MCKWQTGFNWSFSISFCCCRCSFIHLTKCVFIYVHMIQSINACVALLKCNIYFSLIFQVLYCSDIREPIAIMNCTQRFFVHSESINRVWKMKKCAMTSRPLQNVCVRIDHMRQAVFDCLFRRTWMLYGHRIIPILGLSAFSMQCHSIRLFFVDNMNGKRTNDRRGVQLIVIAMNVLIRTFFCYRFFQAIPFWVLKFSEQKKKDAQNRLIETDANKLIPSST